ncbi:MAG: nucleoside-diphosphate sugar epimerase/dehydratase [Halieaceae bacterium]|nr:nucleoside-diphosphate sugar epimerase/dehydratase [Halieaceae bacterium]
MTGPARLLADGLRSSFEGIRTGLSRIIEVPRNVKQGLILSLDMVLVSLALFIAYGYPMQAGSRPPGGVEWFCAGLTLVASAAIFLRMGLYRAVIRFMGQQAILSILQAVSYSALALGAAVFFTQADVPRTLPFVYWAVAMCGIGGMRLIVRASYQARLRSSTRNVLIYGAGESGRQLLTALHHGDQYRVVAFVDDDTRAQHSVINGLQVAHSSELERLIEKHAITQVLLAIPSATSERRREIINSLVGLPVHVRTVPKINELVGGAAAVGQIQDIDLDDLLGRDPVPPHPELIDRCITDKVIMVTGAGGSIGAELCRQILEARPRELVLLDNSEFALYQVERELRELQLRRGTHIETICLLGSVRDQARMEVIYRTFGVQTVYHAAAYKHVPMVEHNVAEGVANNVFGTWHAAEAARNAGVETFVLVSTDKAVRPTNIMGASKRFAELILQGLAEDGSETRFCMVRFGNVLGSSGSVVPLFREQIEKGGPVTVTHPEVSRYFMSIQEAAQLVLQASAMGTGGDVFVLDMGEPVRIVDLAKRMIRLSGHEVGSGREGAVGVDIEFIGLRPGEKLHEELLLGTSVSGTGHPMIMRAEEECLSHGQVCVALKELMLRCEAMDCQGIAKILRESVSGFGGHEIRHDYIWVKRDRGARRRPSLAGAAEEAAAGAKVKELFPRQPSRSAVDA